MCLPAHVFGNVVEAIIDTGATISVVSKDFVDTSNIKRSQSIPVEVGNGETIFTLGTTDMILVLGEKTVKQKVHVLETSAFQAVLGTYFLTGPRCSGIITYPHPPKIIVDGEQIALRVRQGKTATNAIFRIFKKESYTLVEDWKKKSLQELEVPKQQINIDLFANHNNNQEALYCTRQNNAFWYSWSELSNFGENILWANPPFSQLDKVMTKLAMEENCKMVIVTPNWQGDYWMRILEKISLRQTKLPADANLYKGDWDQKPLPAPKWETLVTLVDTSQISISQKELDPKICRQLEKINKKWQLVDLKREMQKYPKWSNIQTLERETQVEQPEIPDMPDLSPIKPCRHEVYSLQNLEEHETYLQGMTENMEIVNDLVDQIDCEFHKLGYMVKENVELKKIAMSDYFVGMTEKAMPSSNFTMSKEDKSEIASLVHQRILHLERQMASEKSELFEDGAPHDEKVQDTENLHGEFEKDIKKFDDQPKLQNLLRKYQDVFGPLPPPGSGCKLVEMDIEIKEEHTGKTLRQKCWPMPKEDAEEIEKQVQELVEAKLVESFPPGTFPKHCSPTFLVDKKESKTRRMVGQYMKLNKMTKPHAGFLPNMEEMIENMASKRFKSKLDLRSGFWQVGLTERARDLTAFTIPNGRVFRWNCMPFGLQGAPGIFQEMMELLIQKVKVQPEMRTLLTSQFLGAFFDDCGVGTDNMEDHLRILEEMLKVCQQNNIRIKLSKCDFMKEEIDYLGFNIGWGTWKPCKSKVEAILRSEVKNLKELRSFLGVLNFYRRHIPNFTYSSAVLTDLTIKTQNGNGPQHTRKRLQNSKRNISAIGVPKSHG